MRRREVGTSVTVNAIGGTHVVLLGMNMDRADTTDLKGFAIRREDLTEDETTWLRSSKTFPSLRENTAFR